MEKQQKPKMKRISEKENPNKKKCIERFSIPDSFSAEEPSQAFFMEITTNEQLCSNLFINNYMTQTINDNGKHF